MLSAAALLTVWETGLTQPPLQRALTLLTLAWPEPPTTSWALCTIGQRDAALLTLREQLFGAHFSSIAPCPHCGERLELSFHADEIRAPLPVQPRQLLQLQWGAEEVEFRLPNSADLLALAAISDPGTAQQQLLERCLTKQPLADPLPAQLVEQILAQMAAADPQGDVALALLCPNCRQPWQMAFDILSYLWTEIHDWAQRTLQEIHWLALAYGWSEGEILALGAARRRLYLTMLGK